MPQPSTSVFQFHKGTIKTRKANIFSADNWDFNSIKVRLKLKTDFSINVQVNYFNSIKVRLKRNPKHTKDDRRLFQFHKGTIKTELKILKDGTIGNFNSIKVRLKQVMIYRNMLLTIFQFHKGTIKTILNWEMSQLLQYFNSIKVRLKLSDAIEQVIGVMYFNSIKVRLKQLKY